MSNNISIRNLDPQEITINSEGVIYGITNVYQNGVDVTVGTKAYVVVPTKTSELTNDSGFITNAEETDPTVPYYVKEITLSDINSWNDKQDALVSGTTIKTINGESLLGSGDISVGGGYTAGYGIDITDDEISNTITSYNDLTDLPSIPDRTSQLVNDSGFINKYVNDLENYLNIELLSNILPKSSDSGDGELYLEDSAETKLNITLNPHEMVQHTTTGKNLSDLISMSTTNGGYINKSCGVIGKVKAGRTYTVSFDCKSDIGYAANLTFRSYYPDATTVNYETLGNILFSTGNRISFTLYTPVYDGELTISANFSSLGEDTADILNFIQLEEGATATPYEEYTGEMPSPNPLYPQDVHWTSRDNTITVGNKNLIDPSSAYTGTSNGITTTYDSDTQSLSYSGTLTGTWCYLTNKINLKYPSGDYTFSINKSVAEHTTIIRLYYNENSYQDVTINKNTTSRNATVSNGIVAYQIYLGGLTISDELDNTLTFQLEIGNTATSIIKHQEIEYPVNLDYPENFCKIDDYADRYFKNVPEDPDYSIALSEGAWYQKLNIFTLYLSENNNFDTVTEYTDYYIFRNNHPNIPGRPPVSDPYGRCSVFGTTGNNKIIAGINYLDIYLDKKVGISTLEDLSDWISNIDELVWFKSAVPEVEQASNETSQQFETLKNDVVAYDGGTTITQVNDDLPFDIEASTFKKVS